MLINQNCSNFNEQKKRAIPEKSKITLLYPIKYRDLYLNSHRLPTNHTNNGTGNSNNYFQNYTPARFLHSDLLNFQYLNRLLTLNSPISQEDCRQVLRHPYHLPNHCLSRLPKVHSTSLSDNHPSLPNPASRRHG